MNRALHPATNPTGWIASAGAVYAVAQWAWTAAGNKGTVSPVVVAIAFAVAALFTRFFVTPVADPQDAIGRPLVPLPHPQTMVKPGTQSSAVTVVQPKIPGDGS